MLDGVVALLAFQLAGELLVKGLALPVSGPICGMALMLCWLHWRGAVPGSVHTVTGGIHVNMPLLFVPIGVGAITYASLLQRDYLLVLTALLLGTLLTLVITALVVCLCKAIGHCLRRVFRDGRSQNAEVLPPAAE